MAYSIPTGVKTCLAMHELNPRTANVCMAFDGFRVNVCRPQAIHTEDGFELDIQAEVYSGHTKLHNFLFLTMVNAFGLIVFVSGPHLGKGTDRTAFRDSNIKGLYEASLQDANIPLNELPGIGDRIFINRLPSMLALKRYNDVVLEEEQEFEEIDSKLRTSVENVHCKICENWKYITYQHQLKIGLGHVAIDIVVAMLLTNALTLVQGSQVHGYFTKSLDSPAELTMPAIEDYFEV